MQHLRFLKVRGFTLIEILVVAAIIVILAAAGVGGAIYVLEYARKMSAMAVCRDVEMAVINFEDENDVLPSYGAEDEDELILTDVDLDMLNVLQAFEDA